MHLPHLRGHLYQHEQLLDADPQMLALHSFSDGGPLHVLETAQQLRGGDGGRRALSMGSKTGKFSGQKVGNKFRNFTIENIVFLFIK